MQTTTTTMNPNLNSQPGVKGSPAVAVEAANPPAGPEKKSVMARIASVSSGIFGKIKSVIPFVNNAEAVAPAPSANTYAPRTTAPKSVPTAVQAPSITNLPNYKPVTPAEIAPKSTMVYQPPMAIPRRGEVVVGVVAQRSAPDLSKDLFAHLSEKEVDLGAKANDTATQKTQTVNGLTSAKLSVYPAGSMPRARVLPRPEPDVDYKFEYKDPAYENRVKSPAPDLSNVFKRQTVLSTIPISVATQRQSKTALEDVNDYVAEQDRQYYADLAERRSRGLVKNLSLWATRIKEDVIGAVAPNYVMRKAYQAAQAPAATEQTSVPQTAPVQPVAPARPSFLSRLKAGSGWNNLKSWFKNFMPGSQKNTPAPQPRPPKRPGLFQRNLRATVTALGVAAAMGSCDGNCGGCDATPQMPTAPMAPSSSQNRVDAGGAIPKGNKPSFTPAPSNTSPKASYGPEKDEKSVKPAPRHEENRSKSAKTSRQPEKTYHPNPKVTTSEPAIPKQTQNQLDLTVAEALLLDGIVSNMKRRVTEMKAVLPALYGPIVLNNRNMGDSDILVTVDSPVAENETAVRQWIGQAEVMIQRLEGPGTVEKLDLAEATEKYILRPTGKKIAEDTESKIAFVKDLSTSETRAAVATARQSTSVHTDTFKRTAYNSYLDSVDKTVDKYSQDPHTDNLDKIRLMKRLQNNANVAGAGL